MVDQEKSERLDLEALTMRKMVVEIVQLEVIKVLAAIRGS